MRRVSPSLSRRPPPDPEPWPAEARFADAAGVRTFYRDSPGGGPTLLLLPGGALDTGVLTWRRVLERLPAHFRIVVPDLPGFGRSAAPDVSYTTAWYTRWLAAFVDALELEPFALGGSSMGAAVALAYALERPDRVRRLVVTGAYGVQGRVPFHEAAHLLARVPGAWRIARRALLAPGVLPAALRLAVHDDRRVTAALVDDAHAGLAPPHALRAFQAWLAHELGPHACATDLRPALPRLRVPTLVLHGRRDALLPFRHAEAAARAIPGARLLAFEAGHLVPRECPDDTTEAIRAFVETES